MNMWQEYTVWEADTVSATVFNFYRKACVLKIALKHNDIWATQLQLCNEPEQKS